VRAACDAAGVSVCCLAARNDLTAENGEEVDSDKERLEKWIEHARILGCRAIRLNIGMYALTPERIARMIARIGELMPKATDAGVRFVIENHPRYLVDQHDVDALLAIVTAFEPDQVRTCPDVGGFTSPSFQMEGFAALARHAGHVHLKSGRALHPDADAMKAHFDGVFSALEAGEYEGPVSLEFMAHQHPTEDAVTSLREVLSELERRDTGYRLPPERTPDVRDVGPPLIPMDTVTLPEMITRWVLDGCELQVGSRVWLYEFEGLRGANRRFRYAFSTGAQVGEGRKPGCCGSRCPYASGPVDTPCQEVVVESMLGDNVRGPRVFFCPMGLASLFVPVVKDDRIFAFLAAGAWRESGTEGMFFESNKGSVDPLDLDELADICRGYDSLNTGKLIGSAATLQNLADELAGLYQATVEDASAELDNAFVREIADGFRVGPSDNSTQ
jgi:sugar phosphate isomerase/epimerase